MNEVIAFIILGTTQTAGMIASLIVGFRLGQRFFNGCNDPYHAGKSTIGTLNGPVLMKRDPTAEDSNWGLATVWYNIDQKNLFINEGTLKNGPIWTRIK